MTTASLVVDRIGNYSIVELLARTDLSEVFVARDPAGTRVCIKRLLPSLARPGSEVALSFRREAALLAEVSHPNVVRVFEVGEQDGVPFTCLELVEGDSLAKWIARGPPAIPQCIRLLHQLALGLERVHQRGIIHADLKPANVLLQPAPDGTVDAKLADFGLASESANQSALIAGTPHYMAPEQTRLVDWTMDARTDLYALGVLGFELLTGRVPFDAADPAALLQMQVATAPPRIAELRPDVPPLLDKMIQKLLQKNPDQRYRNSHSLAYDLAQLLERLQRGEASVDFPLDTAADLSERVSQVFVGRQEELARLERALERVKHGRASMVFVGGVAGVGKSSLLREFQNRSLTTGARFAAGKCYEFARGLPYYVLSESLTDHLRRLQRAPQQARDATLQRMQHAAGDLGGELVKVAPAYAEVFPNAKASVYLGEGRDRARFLDMLGRLLKAAAPSGEPLVLLLDDLQWSDSGTLQALETLVETLTDCSLLLLTTYRSEEVGADHPFFKLLQRADGSKPAYARVDLQPFDRGTTALMIAESLRQPVSAIPDVVIERVHERTEGNPLFVSEVLKALLRVEALGVSNGLLHVSIDKLESANLPGSVVDVVLKRMDELDDATRQVLGTAALIGKGFTLPVLTEAVGRSSKDVFGAIQQGLHHRLLQKPKDGIYRFHHDRVQEAARRIVDVTQRAGIHERLVRWLEQEGAEQQEEGIFELAEHASATSDRARAWRYCKGAAEKALSRYANEQALSYFRRALEHADAAGITADEQRPVRARMTTVLDLLGRYRDSIVEYDRILQGSMPAEQRARHLAGVAYSMQKAGDYQESKKRLLEALSSLGVDVEFKWMRVAILSARLQYAIARIMTKLMGPRVDERSKLIAEIFTRLFNIYSIVEARSLPALVYRLIAAAVRLGPSYELAIAHGKMAISLPQLPTPRMDEAVVHGRTSVEIARKLGFHLVAGQGLMYTSAVLVWSARYREALSVLQGARETLSSLGEMWDLANAHIFSYLSNRACGRYDDAMAHAQALIELGERTQAFGTIANGHQKVAEILLLRGDIARGESHLSKSLTMAEERKLNFDRYQAYKIRGAQRLREGRFADARNQFKAAIDVNESPGVSFFRAYISDTYLSYVEAVLKDDDHLAAIGGVSGATQEAQHLARCLKAERTLRGHLGHAHRVQGLWHWRAGKPARARRAFVQAMDVLHKQDRPVDLALAQMEAASCLADAYPSDAITWARKARAAFADQRLKPWLAQCDAVLVRLGERVDSDDTDKGTGKNNEALRALVSTTQLLMQSRDPDILLEQIVQTAMQLMGAERGFLFTRDGPEAPLVLRVGRTADGTMVAEADAKVSRGVLERVDSTGQGLAVSDTDEDESLRERRSVVAYQLRSVLCAPLVHLDKKLGVLYLDSQMTKAVFGANELELLSSLAAQASIALVSALDFRTIEEMNRNLDAKVLERTRELETANLQVTASMNELRNTTLRLAEAKREALEKELAVARTIQLSMVPSRGHIDVAAARFSGLLEPASFCGGDFWAYGASGERAMFFIGDVTGHGVGSAMLTATARSCLDTLRREGDGSVPLERMMATLNDIIHDAGNQQLVMTAFAVDVDHSTRTLRYCVAGHPPQFILKPRDGKLVLGALGIPSKQLGDGIGNQFKVESMTYEPGTRIVLYTDGIPECLNDKGEMYSDRRFRRLVQRAASDDVHAMTDAVFADVKQFAGDAAQNDDITFVAIELK